jgi:hypothetical protein
MKGGFAAIKAVKRFNRPSVAGDGAKSLPVSQKTDAQSSFAPQRALHFLCAARKTVEASSRARSLQLVGAKRKSRSAGLQGVLN